MDMQRRLLLKSMVVLGSAPGLGLLGSGPAQSAAQTAAAQSAPVLVLVSGETGKSSFLQGIKAARGATAMLQVCEVDSGLGSLQALQHTIQAMQKGYVVGLVDDASGTLIVDLARATGARMHWLGQHAVNATQSRHRLSGDSVIAGDALFRDRLIARGFAADPMSYKFASYIRNGAPDGRQWAADLGFVLTDTSQVAFSTIPQADSGLAPLTGHFVSFAFEI